jgi:hypothetical protein
MSEEYEDGVPRRLFPPEKKSEEYNELMSAQEASELSGKKFRNILNDINENIRFCANAGGYEAEILMSDLSLDFIPELTQVLKSKGYIVKKPSKEYITICWGKVNE